MRMKKKRHGRERLTLLSGFICENPSEIYKKREQVFGNNNEIRVEIGCGKGEFVRTIAGRDKEFNYLAIEKMSDVCTVAIEKYAMSRDLGHLASNGGWERPDGTIYDYGSIVDFTQEEKGNVRFCIGDAKMILGEFSDDSVESIYINFCDPWPKKGYVKRRLTHVDFLSLYSRILKNGGKIFFKTDNKDLFDFSLEQMDLSSFDVVFKTNDLHESEMNGSNIMTEYEKNFTMQGIKINMLIAENKKA